ncbi:dihydrolipoyl dehydrogenase family protein [Pseudalkalibacillus hwajinpoensis]|uniref:NAD(P)/FAD-dependent oxidoreductase n=1 Tax=Guptibacillus hwajinpoensis TaxID=208199 RepID=A0A4U1MEV7_9BACL|nr:NAD(P)/FAD-dependent oxidoreductase [Pseudalkalibacillus hwajinpoensis]TKD68746.1 NAD(P)/FAD-dependent oxidoreductase [Pseudalkalibacillus hwajinpoensis]
MVVGEIIHEKDVVVIGAGPAGYEAALRAAQHGRDVTLVDRSRSGGECLHSGCIPSKLLAISARKMWDSAPGVTMAAEFSMQQWHNEKAATIETLEKGLEMRFKSNKIECVKGSASFLSSERLGVEQGEKFEVWTFEHVIIATGSRPKVPHFLSEDIPGVISVEQLYTVPSVPRRLVIYGGDYMSIEAASTFKALGAEVTVVTECDSLIGDIDETIKRELQRQLKKQKIRVITGASECNVVTNENLFFEGIKSTGERFEVQADKIAYSAGRISNIESLCLEQGGIEVKGNYIRINETCETSISRIYACGDITDGPALAIKAIKQGKTAADHCCGVAAAFALECMPTIIQTQTPLATVGLTEKEATEAGYQVIAESSPMRANGYASLLRQTEGVVKVIRDKESHLLLGFHAIGAGAVELIEKATLALEMAGRDEDFSYPYSPHPGFGELWSETVDLTIEKKTRAIEYNVNQ